MVSAGWISLPHLLLQNLQVWKPNNHLNLIVHHDRSIVSVWLSPENYDQICTVPAFFLLLFVFFCISSSVLSLLRLLLGLLLVFMFAFVLLPHHRNFQRDWRRWARGTWPLLLTVAPFWGPVWSRVETIKKLQTLEHRFLKRYFRSLDISINRLRPGRLWHRRGHRQLLLFLPRCWSFGSTFVFRRSIGLPGRGGTFRARLLGGVLREEWEAKCKSK